MRRRARPGRRRRAGEPRTGGRRAPARRPSLLRLGAIVRARAYSVHHLHSLFHSLGRLAGSPLSSLMTIAVIGIALALPMGLHVVLKNAQAVSAGWENATQISLFLSRGLSQDTINGFVDELRGMEEIDSAAYISPGQALDEFRRVSGFGDALNALPDNPLPPVVVVRPASAASAPALVENLLDRLRRRPEVEIAQLDMEWVKRLYAMMEIARRAVLVLGVLLGLAVLLIVGNTIRLAIQNRRDEIEVQKLIGATDGFIRRPFLYSGYWHGLFGAVFAWLLVSLSLWLLDGPVRRLSLLYDQHFELGMLDPGSTGLLLVSGVFLGFAGAWLAVGRHLREIEPS